MAERLVIDVESLDTGFEVEFEEEVMPDGKVMKKSVWNTERLEALVEYAKKNIDAEGKDVVYTGLASCWVFQALENALAPHRAFHVTAYLDGREVEIKPVSIGEPVPEAGLTFETEEGEGDDLYVVVTCDDQTVKYHNYDVDLLDIAKVMPIPEEKNVYLRVKGATCCILAFAKTYQPLCKSLYLWAFHDNFPVSDGVQIYGCAYTTTDEHRIGVLKEMQPKTLYIP